jgi:hypothetical protein
LKKIDLNLPDVIFQTDNGSEFIGKGNKTKDTASLVKVLSFFQLPYQRLPPLPTPGIAISKPSRAFVKMTSMK